MFTNACRPYLFGFQLSFSVLWFDLAEVYGWSIPEGDSRLVTMLSCGGKNDQPKERMLWRQH